jgi:hypothetical protein
LKKISQIFLEKGLKEPNSYSLEINLGASERDLWLHLDGHQHKVLSLPVRLKVEINVTKIPITVLSYQQQSLDGVLAWVALSKGVIEDKEVSVQLVFKENKEGFLHVVAIRHQGVQSGILIVSPDKGVVEAYIAENLSITK